MIAYIFVPVGRSVATDSRFNGHWRLDNRTNKYIIHACTYSSFTPEPGTYDTVSSGQGWKWQLVKQFLETFDVSCYDYIGFLDDDLITDSTSICTALQLARKAQAKIFQLSTCAGSESTHRILHQQTGVDYTETQFIEGMSPFIHTSLMPLFKELLDFYEFKSGWGLDAILPKSLKAKTIVVHKSSVYHPPQDIKGSYYDKKTALAEMNEVMQSVYPRWMKHKYNEEHKACHIDYTEYNKVVST